MSLVTDFKDLAKDFVDNTFADVAQTFVFQTKTNTSDGQGGYTTAWSNFATITGFVKTLGGNVSGKEMIIDDRIKSDTAKQFSFEYKAGITADMRIVYEGVNYNILPFDDVMDANIWQKIVAYKDEAV